MFIYFAVKQKVKVWMGVAFLRKYTVDISLHSPVKTADFSNVKNETKINDV